MEWYNDSWKYRVKVTVLASKVDADLTDYPIYVNLNNLPAEFHANVNQTDARDIRVTKADGVTEVPREVVFYTAASDTGELHFKGDVDGDVDTDFYIYYGNAEATEPAIDSTYGAENVWTKYFAVYHFHNSLFDATANDNDLTDGGTSDTDSGKIGKGRSFASEYLKTTASLNLSDTQKLTISYWFNKVNNTGIQIHYEFGPNFNTYNDDFISHTDGTYYWVGTKGNAGYNLARNSMPTAGSFRHLVDVYNFAAAASSEILPYVDGLITSFSKSSYNAENTGYFGNRQLFISGRNGGSYFSDGIFDEFRIAKDTFAATWISTEYNNQNSPSTFYSIGSQQTNKTFTADGLVVSKVTNTFTVDGIVKSVNSTTFTIDGIVEEVKSTTFTFDGLVKEINTKTFTIDGIVKEIKSISFTIDGVIKQVATKTFTIDGIIEEVLIKTFTIDGVIEEILSCQITIDGIVKQIVSTTFTVDGIIEEINSKTFTIDGIVLEGKTIFFTIDGIVLVSFSKTFTIDGIVKIIASCTFTIDGLIEEAKSVSFIIDGIILGVNDFTFTIDGIIREGIVVTTATFTIDGIVQSFQTITFTIDGEVSPPYIEFSIDGVVVSIIIGYVLDGSTLPRPDKITRDFVYIKTDYTTLTGKIARDSGNKKEKYLLSWTQLSKADGDLILSIVEQNKAVTFSVDDGNLVIASVNVIPYIASKIYEVLGSNYLVSLVLELIVEEAT